MIPFLRRREVCRTHSTVKRDLICSRLETIDVDYDIRVKNVTRCRFWGRREAYELLLKMHALYEFRIYVDKKDLSRAQIMLRG